MGDWADKKAAEIYLSGNIDEGIDLSFTAAALRQARLDALEEAAKEANRGFTQMPADIDDWYKGYFAGCDESAAAIRALKEKQPECG